MAGSVTGMLTMFTTIERDVGGGVMHPIFYASFGGTVQGTQPAGCSPGLFGVDVSDPVGKTMRDHILYADSKGLTMVVQGSGVLVPGHPSERISNVYTEI